MGRSEAPAGNYGRQGISSGAPFSASAALTAAVCLLAAAVVSACSKPAAAASQGGAVRGASARAEAFRDSYGREVLPPKLPRRIVSLSPSTTEILFALGAGDLLVGRTDYCNYPPEARRIESVGGLTDPSVEKIAGLRADLVVASDHFQQDSLKLIEALKIPVYIARVRKNYEEVYGLVRDLGRLVGKSAEAESLADDMRSRIARVEAVVRAAPSRRPKVYYAISFGEEGDFTAGRDSFLAYFIRTAGGTNLGDGIEGYRYSVEGLFRDEPDVIIAGAGKDAKRRLSRTVPYNRLRAVREGRVHEIDPDLLERIGPRNVEGLEKLAGILHPEAFP